MGETWGLGFGGVGAGGGYVVGLAGGCVAEDGEGAFERGSRSAEVVILAMIIRLGRGTEDLMRHVF